MSRSKEAVKRRKEKRSKIKQDNALLYYEAQVKKYAWLRQQGNVSEEKFLSVMQAYQRLRKYVEIYPIPTKWQWDFLCSTVKFAFAANEYDERITTETSWLMITFNKLYPEKELPSKDRFVKLAKQRIDSQTKRVKSYWSGFDDHEVFKRFFK